MSTRAGHEGGIAGWEAALERGLGGDEFAMILRRVKLAQVVRIAEYLREEAATARTQAKTTLSVGIARWRSESQD